MNCPAVTGGRRRPGPPQWLDQKHVQLTSSCDSSRLCPEMIPPDSTPAGSDHNITRITEKYQIAMKLIVAHRFAYIIGVDTHAATHTYAIITASGEHIDTQAFPTTTAGMRRALSWTGRRTGGDLATLWVIEGTGSYGANLTRIVADSGYRVVEAPSMNARSRHGVGKSDPLDARRIPRLF